MVAIESRPYRVASRSSATASLTLASPVTDPEELAKSWIPGDVLTVAAKVEIHPQFWADTGVSDVSSVRVVLVATCMSTRTTWRSALKVEIGEGGLATSVGDLVVDGDSIADEVKVDAWIVGPGQTASTMGATHAGAKLWVNSDPLVLQLVDNIEGFPTTPVSFGATNRRNVPWSVECAREAIAETSISSAIRLYVNTDHPLHEDIVSGAADPMVFAAIQTDVHVVALQHLANLRTEYSVAALSEHADEDHNSMAALGESISGSLGLPLEESLRIVSEDISALLARSREQTQFGR